MMTEYRRPRMMYKYAAILGSCSSTLQQHWRGTVCVEDDWKSYVWLYMWPKINGSEHLYHLRNLGSTDSSIAKTLSLGDDSAVRKEMVEQKDQLYMLQRWFLGWKEIVAKYPTSCQSV